MTFKMALLLSNAFMRLFSYSTSRRQLRSVSKQCPFSFVPEPGEEAQDMEGTMTTYDMEEADENTFSPIAVCFHFISTIVHICWPILKRDQGRG